MTEIKNLIDFLIKMLSLKLKINFGQKEINSEKTEKNMTGKITTKKINFNKNNIEALNVYKNIIKKINDPEARFMLAFILIFGHFKKSFMNYRKSNLEI